jgi:arylsulfatase A
MKASIPALLKIAFLLIWGLSGCTSAAPSDKPNIILIMADDFGYECVGALGSRSYQTPILDELAANGFLFTNCISQPLCTPSRLKIMTGLYNYRNYDYAGHLRTDQITFGNVMQAAWLRNLYRR